MKPGKGLRRRTALRPGGPLRRTKLKRSTGLSTRSVKPGLRAAERAGRKTVKRRSGGLCEACGMRAACDWQHRQNKSQLGDWSPANGLHVCRTCHEWIHANPYAARCRGWTVLSHEDSTLVEVLRRDSWVLLGAGDDGAITPVIRYRGGPWQCMSHLDNPMGGALRCALGVLHDDDHECGLVTWPQTSKERASV